MSSSPLSNATGAGSGAGASVGGKTVVAKSANNKHVAGQALLFETEESRLRQKCQDLRQKVLEVEKHNEVSSIAVSRAHEAIRRLRFEYALLLEVLEKKAGDMSVPHADKLSADDVDGENIEGIRLADIVHVLSKTPLASARASLPASSGGVAGSNKRRRGTGANSLKKQRLKDPNIPKRPTNAYLIFCEMEKERVKKQIVDKDPNVPTDLSKAMTEAWRGLDDVARKPFYELYEQDRMRYQREIKEYNSKQKNGKNGSVKAVEEVKKEEVEEAEQSQETETAEAEVETEAGLVVDEDDAEVEGTEMDIDDADGFGSLVVKEEGDEDEEEDEELEDVHGDEEEDEGEGDEEEVEAVSNGVVSEEEHES